MLDIQTAKRSAAWSYPAAALMAFSIAALGCAEEGLEQCKREAEAGAAELKKQTAANAALKKQIDEKGAALQAETERVSGLEKRADDAERETAKLAEAMGKLLHGSKRVAAALATIETDADTFLLRSDEMGLGRGAKNAPKGEVESTLPLGDKVLPLVVGMRVYATSSEVRALRVDAIKLAKGGKGETQLAASVVGEGEGLASRCHVITPREPPGRDLGSTTEEIEGGGTRITLTDTPAKREYVVKSLGSKQGGDCDGEDAEADCEAGERDFVVDFFARTTGSAKVRELGRVKARAKSVQVSPVGDTDNDGNLEMLVVFSSGDEGGSCTYVELERKLKILSEQKY